MATSLLRDLAPGYGARPTLDQLIPGYASVAEAPAPPTTQQLDLANDRNAAASMGSFRKAYNSAELGTEIGNLAAEESARRAAGDVAGGDQLRATRAALEQRQGAYAPRVPTLRDINWEPGKAVDWFATQAGSGVASSMNPMIVGAGLGAAGNAIGAIPHPVARAAGAGLRMAAPAAMAGMFYGPSKGEAYKEMIEQPDIVQNYTPEQIDNRASLLGGAGAALETVVPALMSRKLAGAGLKAGRAAPGGVAGGMVANSVEEGLTEVAQKGLTDVAVGRMDPTREFGSAENYLDAFASGAAGVTPHGAVAGVADAGFRRLGVEGDGVKGDVIPLDGKTVPFRTQMKEAAASATAEEKAARMSVVDGSFADDLDLADPDYEAKMAQFGPQRQAALLEELGKIKDPAAAEMAKRVAAADPADVFDPAFEEAAGAVINKAGLMSPDELGKYGSGKKNSMQVAPADLGSMKGPDTPAPKTDVRAGTADWLRHATADHDSRTKFNATYIRTRLGEQAGRAEQDAADILGREIAAMTSEGVSKKTTPLELRRAELAGRALATLLRDKTAGVLDMLASRNPGAHESKAFQAMFKRATSLMDGSTTHKTEAVRRNDAAAELVALIPTDKATALLQDGIDVSQPRVAAFLLNSIEALSEGDTKQRTQLNRHFGKAVVDAMLERVDVGPEIEARFAEPTSGAAKVTDSDEDSGQETSDFEERQEAKSLDKIAPDASLFFNRRGSKAHTAKDWVNMKEGENLPELVGADDVLSAAAGGGNVLEHLTAQATKTHGSSHSFATTRVGDKTIPGISGTEMLNRGNVPQSKREDLMLRYMAQDKAPGTKELIGKVEAMRSLAALDRKLTAITDGKPSVGPYGEKISVVDKAIMARLAINHQQIHELALPDDKALISNGGLESRRGAATRAAAIVRRALTVAREDLGERLQSPDAYFADKYLVVAEQHSNDDYLKMKHTDAQAMVDMGKRALAHADKVGSQKLGPADAKMKATLKAQADANLIWFKSPLGKGAGGNVAIPADMLVKWVRAGRNAHTADTQVKADATSKSATKQTLAYRNDLLEGISGFMDSGHATEGTLPWIENAEGKREDFTTESFTAPDGFGVVQPRLFADDLRKPGQLPPSLDLGGVSQKDFAKSQAIAGDKAREIDEMIGERNTDIARDTELSADGFDSQDRESIDRGLAEIAGSKRDAEEREHHERNRMVMESAADADVKPLRKNPTFAASMKVATSLWRSYALGADRAAGLERIQSYLRSVGRPESSFTADPDSPFITSPDILVGGPQYIEPLAALLTPTRMAWVKKNDPDNLKAMLELRSRVGAVLAARAGQMGGNGAKMGQLVHALSGYAESHDSKDFVKSAARKAWLEKLAARDEAIKGREQAQLKANAEAVQGPMPEVVEPTPVEVAAAKEPSAEQLASRAEALARDKENADADAQEAKQATKAAEGAARAKIDATRGAASSRTLSADLDAKPPAPEPVRAKLPARDPKVEAPKAEKLEVRSAAKRAAVAAASAAPTLADRNAVLDQMLIKDDYKLLTTPARVDAFLKRAFARYNELQALGEAKEDVPVYGRLLSMFGKGSTEDLASFYDENLDAHGRRDAEIRAALKAGADTRKSNDQVTDATGTTTTAEPKVGPQQQAGKFGTPTDAGIVRARMWLRKIGMKDVNILFADAFPDMKGSADYDTVKDIVRIATANPVSVLQRAYHEGLHRFFAVTLAKSPEAKALLEGVVNNPAMIERLAALYKASPAAVAAIRSNREEAVAYAFQLWAFDPDLLSLGKKPTTVFEKVQAFLRRVLGVVRDSEKALAILESFHDGKLAEPSEAGKVIDAIMQTNSWREKFVARFDRQVQAAKTEVIAAINVTRDQEWSATAKTLGEKFFNHSADATADDPAYINVKGRRLKQYSNQVNAIMRTLRGDNQARDLRDLAEALNNQTDAVQPHVQEAVVKVRRLLSRFYDYAKESGLDLGERDPGTYFPRVMNLEYLVENKQAFVDMLVAKYPAVLKSGIPKTAAAAGSAGTAAPSTIEDVAERLFQLYVDHGGVDDSKLAAMREDGVLNPFFASQNTRELHWIRAEDIGPFLSKDPVSTLSRYFSQGVRAVEYTRSFGKGGMQLKDAMAREGDVQYVDENGPVHYEADGPVLTELKAAAKKEKVNGVALTQPEQDAWVNRRHEDFQRSFGAMEGSLGKDISYGWRQAQGVAMAYQTLRTLPLSLFSAMLDPNGIRVNGGTAENFYGAYVRGMKSVFNMWKDLAVGNGLDSRDPDKYENAAMSAGVLDSDLYLEGMGAVSTSEFTAGLTRKINHKFFLANGITAWDRAMRTEAVKAAMQAIVRNEADAVPQHSKRWLRQLGLTQGDGIIRTDAEGDLIVNRHQLATLRAQEKGTTSADEMKQATADMEKIHFALNHWVNRAIMSPNAAIRPSRASDPHFSMFFQLKSFTYAFQESTLKYAMLEAENGNLDSGAQLLRGIPIMIAADVTKAMLTGGGSLPGYMANWTMADWLVHATNRSGIMGVSQLGTDALGNPHGVLAGVVGVVGGPTVSQGVDAVFNPIGQTAVNAVPLVNKVSGLAKSAGGMLDHAMGGV